MMRIVFYFLSFFCLLQTDAFAAKQPDLLNIAVPSAVAQGTAMRVCASGAAFSSESRMSVTFSWMKKSIQVLAKPDKDGWKAETFLPVPVDAKGVFTLTVTLPQNKTSKSVKVRITPVAWPQQKISVNSRYVTPPEEVQKRIAEERKRVGTALNQVSLQRMWTESFVRPVPGVVTSAFGGKRVFNGQPRSWHRGVDLRGSLGDPIRALATGKVLIAEEMYFAGNVIYLDHGQGVISSYCHMSAMDVRPGDMVEAGQIIGRVGATGRVTGPHLHLGLHILGQAVNPLSLF